MFGARPLGRVMQKEVRDPLTDEMLFGALETGGTVTIGAADDSWRSRTRTGELWAWALGSGLWARIGLRQAQVETRPEPA